MLNVLITSWKYMFKGMTERQTAGPPCSLALVLNGDHNLVGLMN